MKAMRNRFILTVINSLLKKVSICVLTKLHQRTVTTTRENVIEIVY